MPYLGINDQERELMLEKIGVTTIDDLFIDIPENLLLKRDLNLEEGYSEWQLLRYFQELAQKNSYSTSFKGAGCYLHHVPALVSTISSRAEFLTSYTPYQPEVSQGTLEAIYRFQSYMAELTGMDIANASMYDGATALAEAITMSWRLNKQRKIFLSKYIHPEYLSVVRSYLDPLAIEYSFYEAICDIPAGSTVVVQNPNFYGELVSNEAACIMQRTVADQNLFLIVAVPEAYALVVGHRPDEIGAQIVCGSAQSFGNPMHYGGAQVGFIACKQDYVRQMPGRIVGKTQDRKGQTGYVLTFQTREQHIKRERASSNICTNQSLHALCTAVYLTQMGSKGLTDIAKDIWTKTEALSKSLAVFPGIEIKTENSFNEFCVAIDPHSPLTELFDSVAVRVSTLLRQSSNLFSLDFSKELYLFAVSEVHALEDLNALLEKVSQLLSKQGTELPLPRITQQTLVSLEKGFAELQKPKLSIPDRGELEVCRYFTNLSQQNFSIDTNFYPLGSCTMKYNPKINDQVAMNQSWTSLHPYALDSQAQGALEVYVELNKALCEITGFHKFTLQSAAGAHGEYTALLMAKQFFADKGEARNIVLVPDSAHGTNPASASMAGFTTISVQSTKDGNVDLADLKHVLAEHQGQVAVFMLTNPNTFGLFNQNILEAVRIIHDDGGLMYYDGANLNAIAGISRPGDMGFDLLHLNLHKTFSTPHGGGGPGAGPVGASERLAPYLPNPDIKRDSEGKLFWDYSNTKSIGRIRSFHGNFNVLLRALSYIKRNGKEGIKRIGQTATLSANYLQARIRQSAILSENEILQPKFNRLCKHEFIITASRLKELYGITALDVAKRLLDKGIHAPTIYFPITIPEIIMIEPTETEPLAALDSLIQALEEIVLEAIEPSTRELLKQAPLTTKFSRFDEVRAVKDPILSSRMEAGCC